ncbi:MAG: hypothetical protein ACM3X5_03430 [Bacillota bacterium]
MHRFRNWREAIQASQDAECVATLISEYVASIRRSDLDGLSQHCRRVLTDPDTDIQAAAVTLLREELAFDGNAQLGAVLHEIAHTFAAASVRLGQLLGHGPTPF